MKLPGYTISVFDRLTVRDTTTQTSIAENIRYNLSAIMNTRRFTAFAFDPSGDPIVALTHYGLPELNAVNTDDETARDFFLTEAAKQISIFEPRLRHVCVFIPEKQSASSRRLEIVIEAELYSEHRILTFRSIFDLSSCLIQLDGSYAERISCTLS